MSRRTVVTPLEPKRLITADFLLGTGQKAIALLRDNPALMTTLIGGVTPLGIAIRHGQVAAVAELLDMGADLQQLDGAGNGPGHMLARLGAGLSRGQQVAELLERLGSRIDWSARNHAGNTALDIAFAEAGAETIEWIWNQGGGLGEEVQGKRGALARAVLFKRPDWWDRLIAEGAKAPTTPSGDFWHAAARLGPSALALWGPRFKSAGIAQGILPRRDGPLDVYLRGGSAGEGLDLALAWLEGPPKVASYEALIHGQRANVLATILQRYPVPPEAHTALWHAGLASFKRTFKSEMPRIVALLLSHGIKPHERQWSRLSRVVREVNTPFKSTDMVALFEACGQGGIQVPWTLKTLVTRWPETEVVLAWLAHHGQQEALTMVKATGAMAGCHQALPGTTPAARGCAGCV